jgi:SAM-dependent methyltransferase
MNNLCTDDNIYSREPEYVHNGIPVFSKKDFFVENYEKIASDHISALNKGKENPFIEEELWSAMEESTRKYIKKYVSAGSRILDVGVGLGRILGPLTQYKRYGNDISLDYLTIAKSLGIEVAMAKIEDLPYHKDFFDAIIICDVLEHVIDLNYCCKKILHCLRPGGILIVRVPFKENLDVYLKNDLPYKFIHLRNFDEASLRLHFEKIFNLNFLEAMPTSPYLQGSSRLKLKLLPKKSCEKLSLIAAKYPEFAIIASALQISEESFEKWIYDLKKENKALFNLVEHELIYGIEINATFSKPFRESE